MAGKTAQLRHERSRQPPSKVYYMGKDNIVGLGILGVVAICATASYYLNRNASANTHTPQIGVTAKSDDTKSTDYFKKVMWPGWIKNECLNVKNCCNLLKNDVGEITCYGLAERFNPKCFKKIRSVVRESGPAAQYRQPDPSKFNPRKVYEDYARSCIEKKYWVAPKIWILPHKWHFPVFDYAGHSGNKRAIKALQRLVGAKPDGVIGPKTLSLVEKTDKTPEDYIKARYEDLKKKKSYKRWKGGMDNRIKKTTEYTERLEKLNKDYTKKPEKPHKEVVPDKPQPKLKVTDKAYTYGTNIHVSFEVEKEGYECKCKGIRLLVSWDGPKIKCKCRKSGERVNRTSR